MKYSFDLIDNKDENKPCKANIQSVKWKILAIYQTKPLVGLKFLLWLLTILIFFDSFFQNALSKKKN